MPRITPGITSGASISSDSADLPRKRARSSRNALAVPTATDSSVTHAGDDHARPRALQQRRVGEEPDASARSPPRNQSSVKPRHGGAG